MDLEGPCLDFSLLRTSRATTTLTQPQLNQHVLGRECTPHPLGGPPPPPNPRPSTQNPRASARVCQRSSAVGAGAFVSYTRRRCKRSSLSDSRPRCPHAQAYIDNLKATGQCEDGCIIGLDGTAWTGGLAVSAEEGAAIGASASGTKGGILPRPASAELPRPPPPRTQGLALTRVRAHLLQSRASMTTPDSARPAS